MRTFDPAAFAALEAGGAITSAAVRIDALPDPFLVWGGYGDLVIEGETFRGLGDRALATATGGALGGADQVLTLELSGIAPEVIALLDAEALKRAPVIVWRLVFDPAGQTLLGAYTFRRGRLDQLQVADQPGGASTIRAQVQGAARGLGRSGARMRSDTDQRLISETDRSMRSISFASQKTLYWAGKPPSDP